MRIAEWNKRVEAIFAVELSALTRSEALFAEAGEERMRIVHYRAEAGSGALLRKVVYFVLENGFVWNKDDRTKLDPTELIAGVLVPADDLPLPICAFEASLHLGKYDHLNIDLVPLSRDPRYREAYSAPVRELRRRHTDLPGLLSGAINPELLGPYTSGGMFSGDIPVAARDRSLPWWFAYLELYKSFLDASAALPILREEAIIAEARQCAEVFLAAFRKETPRILLDIPHLYTADKGAALGTALF